MIRPATLKDAADWLMIRNTPMVRFWSAHQRPITEADHAAWFQAALDDPRRTLLVLEENGTITGWAWVQWAEVGEVAVAVHPDWQGSGRGQQLLDAVSNLAGRGDLVAYVHPSNMVSLRAFGRSGYVLKAPGFTPLVRFGTPLAE